jgi:hypothetical protein
VSLVRSAGDNFVCDCIESDEGWKGEVEYVASISLGTDGLPSVYGMGVKLLNGFSQCCLISIF